MSDLIGVVASAPNTKSRGGPQIGRLLLEACYLSCDEMEGVSNSPHQPRFTEALVSAVQEDRMKEAPDTLGYMRDSSGEHELCYRYDRQAGVTTYNGNAY